MTSQGDKPWCELCSAQKAHYREFPIQVNGRLYRGKVCKRCARQGPCGHMMSEEEAIEFLRNKCFPDGEFDKELDKIESEIPLETFDN